MLSVWEKDNIFSAANTPSLFTIAARPILIQIYLILATKAAAKPNAIGGQQRVVSVAQLQQQQRRQEVDVSVGIGVGNVEDTVDAINAGSRQPPS